VKSTADQLRAALAVRDLLTRLPPNRALSLGEIADRTGIAVTRLRRLLPAMMDAGVPVVMEPDPASPGQEACRPLVYSLAPLRDLREGSCAGGEAAA
jgi:predicted transcriptional regulator